MLIETDDIMIGLAWDLEQAEAILDADHPSQQEIINLPVILLAVTAADEDMARKGWWKKYPHLEINTIVPLGTLIDEGAAS